MRGNNRKSIEKCRKKLPQFTTMNVIDGQAGLVIYSSLIFYSLTIDNILNIIVLLILAGISISMLTGQNGILTNASKAKNETGEAQIEEKVKLSVGDALTRGTGTLEDENLKSALNSYIGKDKYSIRGDKEKGWTVQVIENGKSYDISSMGKISKSLPSTAEGQPADTPIKNPTGYGENAQATADGKGKYFAKPDGATYLEGTVDTGVVVSIKS